MLLGPGTPIPIRHLHRYAKKEYVFHLVSHHIFLTIRLSDTLIFWHKPETIIHKSIGLQCMQKLYLKKLWKH